MERLASHVDVNDNTPVTVRYFDLGEPGMKASLLCGADTNNELKQKVLTKLGIEWNPWSPTDKRSALQAWLDQMAKENGLPATRPAHRALGDAILSTPAVGRFVFFLA